jgi:large subunit ribosomal protein L30
MAKTAEKKAAPKKTTKARAKTKSAPAKRLTIKLVKSTIGFNNNQWLVVESLGLRRINHTIEVADTPAVRGMIHKVRHLLTVTGDTQ